jgi:peptide/nickel transport system substrate-binding protein
MGSFYSSQTMDGLLVEEVALTTVEERTPVLEEIQDLLAQDMPNIPLYQRPQFVAFRKNVKGVILDPLQIFRYYLITKDEWK